MRKIFALHIIDSILKSQLMKNARINPRLLIGLVLLAGLLLSGGAAPGWA
jgi:hypothetical protein